MIVNLLFLSLGVSLMIFCICALRNGFFYGGMFKVNKNNKFIFYSTITCVGIQSIFCIIISFFI